MIEIDRYKIYSLDNYSFKNFVNLSLDEKAMILSWRNDPRISKWMCNRKELSMDNHLAFIDSLDGRTDAYYWLVYKDEIPVGVFDIVDIDLIENDCEPGYYLNPEYLDSGIGLQFNYYCRSFVYHILDITSVKGHILVGNTSAYTMSQFFGVYAISKIVKDGAEYLEMRGNRDDFVEVTLKSLSRDFIRFVKNHTVDWNTIIAKFDNYA